MLHDYFNSMTNAKKVTYVMRNFQKITQALGKHFFTNFFHCFEDVFVLCVQVNVYLDCNFHLEVINLFFHS